MRAASKSNRLAKARLGLVRSSQSTVHPQLGQVVRRHLETRWLEPYHPPTSVIYHELKDTCGLSADRPFVLDSGCGTGKSTHRLARQFPQHLVIGVDRSRKRLAKGGWSRGLVEQDNCVLIRAELSTFWRLLLHDGHLPDRHFLLYPNPWPKPRHLQKRWHGHPVFPQFLALGGDMEMRCNWEIYALEFALAVSIATGNSVKVKQIDDEECVSPFERKYHDRGQKLYSVCVPATATATSRDSNNAM